MNLQNVLVHIHMSLSTEYPRPSCCLTVITHQVHSGRSVTQGHADPGGRVSDDLVIHYTLFSHFVFARRKALMRTLWRRRAHECLRMRR